MKRDASVPYRQERGVWILGPFRARWVPEERIWIVTRTSNNSWETSLPNLQKVVDWYEEVK